ncbi:YitT family protein [Clostridium sp. SYSU_GA19001]|uniref:YitT family protein n=1 Tax=Clostridium caldaquaticum TaxID=2940653 RepID=UPI002077171D|nr:YitT family protein [Clostridium caldaquaticum]MCM8711188.1 YitT family protein [Clostridium caldaquaticum]
MNFHSLKTARRVIITIAASFFSAVALNMFIVPHKLLSGGVSGIALIIQYLTNLPAGIIILTLNIPLFLLSLKELDKEFTFLTIIGTISNSIFLIITRNVSKLYFAEDIILSCIYGGVINGAAIGIVFSNHGSLGGTDIISMYLRRKYNLELGKVSFSINLLIVSVGSIFFGIESGLYTLISMYIVSNVIDKMINGFSRKKMILVVTNREAEMIERIKTDLGRSSTLINAVGTYTKKEKKILYCVLSLSQVPKAKTIVQTVDPYAFMSILDASEILGEGFKKSI